MRVPETVIRQHERNKYGHKQINKAGTFLTMCKGAVLTALPDILKPIFPAIIASAAICNFYNTENTTKNEISNTVNTLMFDNCKWESCSLFLSL